MHQQNLLNLSSVRHRLDDLEIRLFLNLFGRLVRHRLDDLEIDWFRTDTGL